jgi:hypothetical protein
MGRNTGPFLVGPIDDLDRTAGRHAEIIEGAHRLERRQHPESAVELASRGLAVEMAADQHRLEPALRSRPAGEHVP